MDNLIKICRCSIVIILVCFNVSSSSITTTLLPLIVRTTPTQPPMKTSPPTTTAPTTTITATTPTRSTTTAKPTTTISPIPTTTTTTTTRTTPPTTQTPFTTSASTPGPVTNVPTTPAKIVYPSALLMRILQNLGHDVDAMKEEFDIAVDVAALI